MGGRSPAVAAGEALAFTSLSFHCTFVACADAISASPAGGACGSVVANMAWEAMCRVSSSVAWLLLWRVWRLEGATRIFIFLGSRRVLVAGRSVLFTIARVADFLKCAWVPAPCDGGAAIAEGAFHGGGVRAVLFVVRFFSTGAAAVRWVAPVPVALDEDPLLLVGAFPMRCWRDASCFGESGVCR